MERFRRLARRVRIVFPLAALALGLAGVAAQSGPEAPARSDAPRVLALTVKGAITGGTAEFLEAALQKAKVEGHDAVAITLDTPGGMLDATREIVQALLASEAPVVVWVGPAGAHAGSAGVFLTLAADVAAMHPTSNIGAAHPVTGGGKDVEEEAGKDMAKKVENDTAAFARSVAQANGRNAEWAEKAVRESVAVTAEEAVKLRVVDFTAPDMRAALEKADGRTVETPSGKRTFRGKDAVIEPYEKTIRQRVLSFLADPNVVALLFTIGSLGIAIEFYHPGLVVPGVVGLFCLLLAFLAMRVIPVNVGAVLLILAGVGLLVAEAYITVHGLAGLGGAVAIVLGTLFFIDKSSFDYQFAPGVFVLSPWIVWPTPAALVLVLAFMAWKVTSSRRGPLKIGVAGLVGSAGETLSEVGPEGGEVFVHGEYWHGRSASPIPKGARVRVVAVEGLVVSVVADDPGTR
jgi:membrane-bound serine protease (ClpP class)